MRFYDFRCPAGHSTERRESPHTSQVECACGQVAKRAEVNHFAIVSAQPRGVPVAHYLEAAREAEYAHGRTDDPQVKAATRPDVWRPALQRARTRVHERALGIDNRMAFVDPRPKLTERERSAEAIG